jgi:hypothetical protein
MEEERVHSKLAEIAHRLYLLPTITNPRVRRSMTAFSMARVEAVLLQLRSRTILTAAPAAALVYPFVLKAFNEAITAANVANGASAAIFAAAFTMLLSFTLPLATLIIALRLAELETLTQAQLRAKQVAFFSVAAPTIFVFLGVLTYMAGHPATDITIWIVFWVAMIVFVALGDHTKPATVIAKPIAPALRVAHGVSAAAIVAIFLVFHISNHLVGVFGPDAHAAVMKIGRHVYRNAMIEPVLVGLIFFQVGSGLYFTTHYIVAPMDRFRAFQLASGIYIAFYAIGHMDSVFIFARIFLGIDTDWGFATGAPTGLVKDPWNIRLVPHYALGVFFALSHLAAGLRVVLLSHGMRRQLADRVMVTGAIAAGLVATIIILAMCGLRLRFA